MPKKKLEYFDATTPEENEGTWVAELLYNSSVVGSVYGDTEKEILKYIKRWVFQNSENSK